MTYEEELLDSLKEYISDKTIIVEEDNMQYFQKLSESYPVVGSKIDWEQVEGAIVVEDGCTNAESDFFNSIVNDNSLLGDCIILGDSQVDKAIITDVKSLKGFLKVILDIPQHNYIIASDFSWCMVFTMEGDMCFGFKEKHLPILEC